MSSSDYQEEEFIRQSNFVQCDDSTRYQAAKSMIRRMVLSGEVGQSQQLKPELEICRDTNLSRTTVRKAIADLVEEGLLVRFRGRGTFVNIERSKSQQKLLALLVSHHEGVSGAYDLMIRGAQDAAARLGYQLILANARNEMSTAMDQVIRLNELRVAGTLVVPLQTSETHKHTKSIVNALIQTGQKVVLVDDYSQDGHVSVSSQNKEAMVDLTNHLIDQGYRRIAFLTCLSTEVACEREAGFLEAMKEHGLDLPPEYFLTVGKREPEKQGIQEIDVFMAMREPPEAIICLHDIIALNAMKRCKERGWRVPEDVAIVGFDDLPQAAVSSPPLTSVHQPLRRCGARAVELIVKLLEGVEIEHRNNRLPCHLVIRESSKKAVTVET
ncbi:GntR family transcriptional regulator [Cerasicoccus fimbriatus]|uniref:GntR family transcriptional regulator n=1 Tax=Cerasicoccus fimbriatus TaxID=3014554 RepID=UPI0022B565FC|nr:GntR family transcriptional regulator [Cerasicoccus sp. TK19100]